MDKRTLAVVGLSAVLGGGCALSPSRTEQAGTGVLAPERVAAVRRASQALDNIPAEAGDGTSAEWRDVLWEFEREVIRQAVRLEQQDAWDQAERVLGRAVDVVPGSRILRSALAQFDDRRAAREQVLRAELAIHQGEQLLKDAEAYQRLERVKGDGLFAWLEGRSYRQRRDDTASVLRRHARDALERQDYYLARRCLVLAVQLDRDEPHARDQLKQVDRKIAEIRGRLTDRPSVPKVRIEPQIAELTRALQTGRLQEAQTRLQRLQRRFPDDARLQALSLELGDRVRQAIEKGKVLYSEGKVEQALELWRELRPLAPDNIELLSSISRAEKVLQNLRVLSDNDPEGHSS